METTLRVEGMSCGNCAARVAKALEELPGVTAEVSHEEGVARVIHGGDIAVADMQAAVQAAGYAAEPA